MGYSSIPARSNWVPLPVVDGSWRSMDTHDKPESLDSSVLICHCRLGQGATLALVVDLDREAGLPDEAAVLRDAIHEFFSQRAQAYRRRLRELFRVGRTSLGDRSQAGSQTRLTKKSFRS
jgi:hypothetical protein